MGTLNRFTLPETRKRNRETRWDLQTGKHAGARAEISERQLHSTPNPQETIDWYKRWATRRIQEEIEKMGLTTHPEIILDHGEWDLYQDPMLFTISLRGQFPPRRPIPGDEAYCENGRLAGSLIAVPDGILYTYDRITPLGADDFMEYEPVAFDTATGRWVYRTTDN